MGSIKTPTGDPVPWNPNKIQGPVQLFHSIWKSVEAGNMWPNQTFSLCAPKDCHQLSHTKKQKKRSLLDRLIPTNVAGSLSCSRSRIHRSGGQARLYTKRRSCFRTDPEPLWSFRAPSLGRFHGGLSAGLECLQWLWKRKRESLPETGWDLQVLELGGFVAIWIKEFAEESGWG